MRPAEAVPRQRGKVETVKVETVEGETVARIIFKRRRKYEMRDVPLAYF